MEQIILHAIGDYITQNDWMANHKTQFTLKGWIACFIHATIYSLPFLLIGSFSAFWVIYITHFLIDKFRLALWIVKIRNWNFSKSGVPDSRPEYLTVWLLIIADNTLHLIINYISIKYL